MTETLQAVVLESRQPSDYQQQLAKSLDLESDLIVTPISYTFSELTHAAASVTRTGKVGTFGGVNVPPVTIFMDGFAGGIAYYSFKGGTHLGTLENGGVGIAPFHNLETLISPETMNELEQITADIIAGRIKTRAGQ